MPQSKQCPPFPAGSVDFNAFHEAAMAGNLEDYIAKLVAKDTVPTVANATDAAMPTPKPVAKI